MANHSLLQTRTGLKRKSCQRTSEELSSTASFGS
ncbi:hypothetical protein ACHAXM_000038 [Skeletonema potamos]